MEKSNLKFLPLISSLFADGKVVTPHSTPLVPSRNYGNIGWTGFTGSNADKMKHFNKKRHGLSLRRKHRRVS